MNTLILINWPKVATWMFVIALFIMLIMILSWIVAELQAKKFKVEYETLKDFINKVPITKEYYNAIYDMFNEMCCYSDNDKILVKKLWSDFKYKFKDISPININNQAPESIPEENKRYFSRRQESNVKSIIHE